MEVKGKKAIVVGGASGMAKASAELLAERRIVAILYRPQSAGADVANALGGTVHACDVMDDAGTESAIARPSTRWAGRCTLRDTAGGGIGRRTLSKEARTDRGLPATRSS